MLSILIVCANVELILLILTMFPEIALGIASLLIGIREGPYVTLSLLGGLFALGLVFDAIREAYLFPKGYQVPHEYSTKIRGTLSGYWSNKTKDFPIARLRVLFGDLSVGAHVSGLIIPKIAISGGLFLGLLTNNWASKAIVAHEIGHVRNGDRWLFGVIAAVFGLSAMQAFDLLLPSVFDRTQIAISLRGISESESRSFLNGISGGDPYPGIIRWISIATHLFILRCILHWREYAADAVAVLTT